MRLVVLIPFEAVVSYCLLYETASTPFSLTCCYLMKMSGDGEENDDQHNSMASAQPTMMDFDETLVAQPQLVIALIVDRLSVHPMHTRPDLPHLLTACRSRRLVCSMPSVPKRWTLNG